MTKKYYFVEFICFGVQVSFRPTTEGTVSVGRSHMQLNIIPRNSVIKF